MNDTSKYADLFRVIKKSNPNADKVVFFLTSYRAPWFIYSLVINKLRKSGYEVLVYDFKDSILDNDNPSILPEFVELLCADMHGRVKAYELLGIKIFDGVGSSLGSFLLYNYAIRYPLRRVALNTVSYMSQVVFTSQYKQICKTRDSYIAKGYDLNKLEEKWKLIDSPESGKNIKVQSTLIFTALNDKFVSKESAQNVIKSIKLSNTRLSVITNERLNCSIPIYRAITRTRGVLPAFFGLGHYKKHKSYRL